MFNKLKTTLTDKRKLSELFVGFGLLLFISLLAMTRLLDPFEHLFLDLRFRVRGTQLFPSSIALVGIDEASLDALGKWPWSRDIHGALVELLGQESFRPAILGFDVLFETPDANAQNDQELAAQIKNFKNRVILSYFMEKGYASGYEKIGDRESRLQEFAISSPESGPPNLENFDKVSMPMKDFADISDLAFVNAPVDPDGRARRTLLLARYHGKVYPSLDLLIALYQLGAEVRDIRLEKNAVIIEKSKKGKVVIPVDDQGRFLINYYGTFSNITGASFVNLLEDGSRWAEGGKADVLPIFKDKIVLIGATALGLEDRRATPFQSYEAGISLHAQTIANILEGKFLMRAAPAVSYAALLGVGLVTILITMFFRITKSLPLVTALSLVYFWTTQAFFLRGLWIDFAVQGLSIVVLFIGITSFRYFTALEELKRTQEQLIQSAKMASLGQLSAGISHEFRNILNAINLHVEYCSRPGTSPERVTKYMGVIKKIMENASQILNGLLVFARKSESVKVPGDMKKTVEDTLLLVEKEMMMHNILVKSELEEVEEISYDPGQISQVIMNLMNNARDAMKDREGKEITIKLKKDSKGVRLDIGDNGSGIPPQVLKRLFEPFVTSKAAGKGTGLGLSVCHGIIRSHGGDITVTTAPEKGTTWHIFLPK